MKLKIEIPDANGSDDWECHRELLLAPWHPERDDVLPELLVAYDQSVVLPNGEALVFSAHYGKHNRLCWIMVGHTAVRSNAMTPATLISDTSQLRLAS
jgi:hypothetical protein